jgi:hypothetical protein
MWEAFRFSFVEFLILGFFCFLGKFLVFDKWRYVVAEIVIYFLVLIFFSCTAPFDLVVVLLTIPLVARVGFHFTESVLMQ